MAHRVTETFIHFLLSDTFTTLFKCISIVLGPLARTYYSMKQICGRFARLCVNLERVLYNSPVPGNRTFAFCPS